MRFIFNCIITCLTLLYFSPELFSSKNTGKNLIPGDSDFETGVGMFDLAGMLDDTACATGKRSYRINIDREMEIPMLWISVISKKEYTFSFYAKSDQESLDGEIFIGNDPWSHSVRKKIKLTPRWTRYRIKVKAKKNKYNLGISINAPSVLWLDAAQFEEGGLSPYSNNGEVNLGINIPSKNNKVFLNGEDIDVDILINDYSCPKSNGNYYLDYYVADYYGNKLSNGSLKVNLDKKGYYKKSLSLNPKKLGFFAVKARLFRNSEEIKHAEDSFVMLNSPIKISEGATPFCGICSNNYPILPSSLKRIGVRWRQVASDWSFAYKKQWKLFDDIFYNKKYGFKTIPYITTRIVPPELDKEKWRMAFKNLAERYKDCVDLWEITAEADLLIARNPYYIKKYPSQVEKGFVVAAPIINGMTECINIAAHELKKQNPRTKIGIIRASGVDCENNFPFSQKVIEKTKRSFDLFPMDPYITPRYISPGYPESSSPERLLQIFENALKLTHEKGSGQKIYISELGWGLNKNCELESIWAKKHAFKLARVFLLAKMEKDVFLCKWFSSRGCEEYNCQYGIWRNLSPLPAVAAYSTVSRVVENVLDRKCFKWPHGIYGVVFRKEYGADAAIWTENGDVRLFFPETDSMTVYDLMGNPLDLESSTSGYLLIANESPVFISIHSSKGFETLCENFGSVDIQKRELKISSYMKNVRERVVVLKNSGSKDIIMDVSLFLPNGKKISRKCLSKANKTTCLSFLIDMSDALNGEYKIVARDNKCSGEYTYSENINLLNCPYISFPVKIDGDISEWGVLKPFARMSKDGLYVPAEPNMYEGDGDLNGTVYIGHDNNFLYFAAEINDDRHFNKNKKNSSIWNGDCIQMAIDAAPWKEGKKYNEDIIELGVACAVGEQRLHQWTRKKKRITGEIVYAIKRDEKQLKTCYELKIPMKYIGASKPGDILGFNFVVFDDDSGNGYDSLCQFAPGIVPSKSSSAFKKIILAPVQKTEIFK